MEKSVIDFIERELEVAIEVQELENYISQLTPPRWDLVKTFEYDEFREILEDEILSEIEEIAPRAEGQREIWRRLKWIEEQVAKFQAKIRKMEVMYSLLRFIIRQGELCHENFMKLAQHYHNLSNISLGRSFVCLRSGDVAFDNLYFLDPTFLNKPLHHFPREEDMIFYEPAPATIILSMAKVIKTLDLSPKAIFYDLGSGVGRVPVLLHLLTGMKTKGVEWDPYYHKYGKIRVQALELEEKVTLINSDARRVNLFDGEVFFLYHPFERKILAEVIDHLKKVSRDHRIYIMSLGACSRDFAKEDWLEERKFDEEAHPGFSLFYS